MKRYKNSVLLMTIICMHALWFIAGLIWQHFYNGDSYEYIYLAENIRKGVYYGGNPALPLNEFRLSLRTPVYSLFLLFFYTLTGYHTWIIMLAQNVLSVISCWIIHQAFRRLHPGKRFSYLYLAFLFFYPAQMFFATTMAPDTLLQFFMMLYVYQLMRFLAGYQAKHMGLMSLWLVLAALTKPVVYPFVFVHLIFALWYLVRKRKPLLLAYGLIPLAAMTGYGLWNQERTGLFHISSIQSSNMLNYNVKLFLAHKYGQAYADSVIGGLRKTQQSLPGLKAQYEYADQESKAIIKRQPVAYGLFHLKESIRYFVEPGKSELDLYTGYLGYAFRDNRGTFYQHYREEGIEGAWTYLRSYPWLPLLLLVFLFNLLRIAGGLLFVFDRRFPLDLRVCLSLYLLYFAAVVGPVANARYFLPVLPVLSAMAMLGYGSRFLKRKNKTQHAANLVS